MKFLTLDKHLDSNEKIMLFFRPSRRAYILQYILWGFLFILAIIFTIYRNNDLFILWDFINLISGIILIISIIMLIRIEYRIWSRRYALTDERLLYAKGIFSETFRSSTYDRITDIAFHQSLWDKIMKTGTVKVDTAGTDSYEIRYRKIYDPLKVKKMINDHQTAKKKSG